MMRRLACLAAFALFAGGALAAGNAAPAFSVTANLESGPIALRGTLGDAPIQINLKLKPGGEQGIEGDYFYFGSSGRILLAGEYEALEFSLEESENGKDVSGTWYGAVDGDTLSGTWQSVDGAISKPFSVRLVRPGPQQAAVRRPAAKKN